VLSVESGERLAAPSYEIVDVRFGVERKVWDASLFVTKRVR
jgi:hypothetical protein